MVRIYPSGSNDSLLDQVLEFPFPTNLSFFHSPYWPFLWIHPSKGQTIHHQCVNLGLRDGQAYLRQVWTELRCGAGLPSYVWARPLWGGAGQSRLQEGRKPGRPCIGAGSPVWPGFQLTVLKCPTWPWGFCYKRYICQGKRTEHKLFDRL